MPLERPLEADSGGQLGTDIETHKIMPSMSVLCWNPGPASSGLNVGLLWISILTSKIISFT